MGKLKAFLWAAGLMAATTFGAGLFALPYVFLKAGWLTGIFYLGALSGVVAFVQDLYRESLDAVDGRERLMGLSRTYLGLFWQRLAPLIIFASLVLALLVYLILADRFIKLIFPDIGIWGVLLFWLAGSAPIILKLRRFVAFEMLGVVMMAGIVLLIAFGINDITGFSRAPALDLKNAFLPFGAVLFSLAGWTAVEPILDYERLRRISPRASRKGMAVGVCIAAALYLIFVAGIFGSAAKITDDTLSGATNFPQWKFLSVIILGLVALWTSYMPIALEIHNGLEKDFRWPAFIRLATVVFVPPLLFFLGLSNFIAILGLAGGAFLGLNYLLIILVARKVLRLGPARNFFALLFAGLFILAAVYEVYYFVVQ